MVSFPYYAHTTPIRINKDMVIWLRYDLLGTPGKTPAKELDLLESIGRMV